MDEPTTGLDYRECEKVMRIVKALHNQGTTVIMVCHDMEVVADFAQRVIVMTGGRAIADGPTFEVLRNPQVLAAADLIPPQIVEIALNLQQLGAPGAVTSANTLEEMIAALGACAGKGGEL